MTLIREKEQINVQKELQRLALKLRKTGSLSDRDIRAIIPSSYGVGRQTATESNEEPESASIEYEAVIVDSTDGVFSFEIMTDKSLLAP